MTPVPLGKHPRAVKVIWQTPTYPDYQWSIRGDVDQRWGEGFTEQVKVALLAIDQPELLAAFPRSSFVSADNTDYAATRDTAIAIGLIDGLADGPVDGPVDGLN